MWIELDGRGDKTYFAYMMINSNLAANGQGKGHSGKLIANVNPVCCISEKVISVLEIIRTVTEGKYHNAIL